MKIVNIVAFGDLHQQVNLQSFKDICPNYSYGGKKGVYGGQFSFENGIILTVFGSGKCNIMGSKTFDDIEDTWNKASEILSKILDKTKFEAPKVSNIVAQHNYPTKINLEDVQKTYFREGTVYEPEIFPGLKWQTKYGTVFIFSTGRFGFTGVKSIEILNEFCDYITKKIDAIM